MATIAEACRILGVSRVTLKKYLRKCAIEPVPHELDARVLLLSEEQLQRLAEVLEQRPIAGHRTPTPPVSRRGGLPTASLQGAGSHANVARATRRRAPSRPSGEAVDALPPGWIARSTWSRNHNLNDLSVRRQMEVSDPLRRIPAQEDGAWVSKKEGERGYEIVHAFRSDQLAEAARVARLVWSHRFHPCEDPDCPCKS